jgi:hypothetical protein
MLRWLAATGKETMMRNAKSRIFAAVVGTLSMGAAAWAADPSPKDLQNQVQDLTAKVAALEAKQASSSKDMAAAIDGMLRDSEKRSQLLATAGDMSAGYDNGFFIKAGDAWVLRPFAIFQFRNVTNFRSSATAKSSDTWDNGFEVARMKVGLEGTAFSKDLTYAFVWDSTPDSGGMILTDAWAKYMFADQWGMRAGQFRDPVGHEWLTSDGRLLAVDRSLMDALLGGGVVGYTQGVTVVYNGERDNNNPLSAELGYTDGANQLNTSFVGRGQPLTNPDPTVPIVGSPGAHTLDWGVAGRVEYKVMGDWTDYADFTAKGNKQDLFVLGAGGDWSQGGDGDLFVATVDGQYENAAGLGIYAAGFYRKLTDELTGGGSSGEDLGGLLQAGYMIAPQWEAFGRYDISYIDHMGVFGPGTNDHTFQELTVGLNYYMGVNGDARHRAKISVDLSYLINGSPAIVPAEDILDDNSGNAEWMLRAQFQLWI